MGIIINMGMRLCENSVVNQFVKNIHNLINPWHKLCLKVSQKIFIFGNSLKITHTGLSIFSMVYVVERIVKNLTSDTTYLS